MEQNTILPIDMLLEIFDRLPIPTLIQSLRLNKNIYNKSYQVFREKIEEYREIKEIIIPKYTELIENRQLGTYKYMITAAKPEECQRGPWQLLILIDDYLSSIMNIQHMPQYSGSVIYTFDLFCEWWSNYLESDETTSTFIVDELANRLTNIPINNKIKLGHLFLNLLNHINTHPNISMTPQIAASLVQEWDELLFDHH